MLKRFELASHSEFPDHRTERFRKTLIDHGVLEATSWKMRYVDVIWFQTELAVDFEKLLKSTVMDPVLHEQTLHPLLRGPALEKRLLPGMTDNRARTLLEALTLKDASIDLEKVRVRTGEMVVLESGEEFPSEALEILRPAWINPVIHESQIWKREEIQGLVPFEGGVIEKLFPDLLSLQEGGGVEVDTYDFSSSFQEVQTVNQERMLALSDDELRAIQAYFSRLDRECTDVELEIIAQTWSEHCKHKIFAAEIDYHSVDAEDPATEIPRHVDGLFRQTIRKTTEELQRPWLLSVFSDNAGIVRFTSDSALCLKVETHNSPSALDPFGGAITGIVGVNRDILGCGLGAKPIANLDVFCVAPPDVENPYPEKIISPAILLEGIRAGVEAGGNQSGIPTVNGSVTFHPSYLGKPLVFCGTLGLMPLQVQGRPIQEKKVIPGDRVIMIGGRIGRDGIHGATFSSMALTETVSGSVVQLGDPITQKRVLDFLIEARDANLYRAITDNGAGGLSSSVGEMATLCGGAHIDVARAPVKVPGLKPYERVISESQERMTLAVSPDQLEEFLKLARRRGVEASDIGEFDATGRFRVDYDGTTVADLDLEFLHEGNPRLKLQARWGGPKMEGSSPGTTSEPVSDSRSLLEDWRAVLSHPNVASKEAIIRQYDHEVQGRTIGKPLVSLDRGTSPGDAAVLRLNPQSREAAVLGHGLAPLLSEVDPWLMAQMAVDEAVRNLLSTGAEYRPGDPEPVIALVDNFCWPDPLRSPEKTAALVRAAYGMRKACLEFGIPLISGKDSMKNDFKGVRQGKPIEISVIPTLLMTALGRLKEFALARSTEFKKAGDQVYLLGPSEVAFAGSILEDLGRARRSRVLPQPSYGVARNLYGFLGGLESQILQSAHDCSEGGAFAAIAEASFARALGVEFTPAVSAWSKLECFGEGFHRFIVSCRGRDAALLQKQCMDRGIPFLHVGEITEEPVFKFGKKKISLQELQEAWEGRSPWNGC